MHCLYSDSRCTVYNNIWNVCDSDLRCTIVYTKCMMHRLYSNLRQTVSIKIKGLRIVRTFWEFLGYFEYVWDRNPSGGVVCTSAPPAPPLATLLVSRIFGLYTLFVPFSSSLFLSSSFCPTLDVTCIEAIELCSTLLHVHYVYFKSVNSL